MDKTICKVKHIIQATRAKIDEKFLEQFGFKPRDVSWEKIVTYLHGPKDPSSLAVIRALFGLAMLVDVFNERGATTLVARWGSPTTCHFPLFSAVRALPLEHMWLVYSILALGAFGIAFGCRFRASVVGFTVCYWYLFLVEKSLWNNHSYLFGLVATLLCFTNAHCYWSVDSVRDASIKRESVPYWNYFILKYQFFILYFVAGLKKGSAEWLSGYAMRNLSEHWVFYPLRLFLTAEETDYLVVHLFVFVFDLTVAFWMMWARTRHVAMLFCALFHLMNSRLFNIGMFPWVCLATMPLFYPFDWPKTFVKYIKALYVNIKMHSCKCNKSMDIKKTKPELEVSENIVQNCVPMLKDDVNQVIKEVSNPEELKRQNGDTDEKMIKDGLTDLSKDTDENNKDKADDDSEEAVIQNRSGDGDISIMTSSTKNNTSKTITVVLILVYVLTQAFLPFSHFITKGYNNWSNGLYGYSWDMMVHNWEVNSVELKIVDNDQQTEFYIEPSMFALNDRWTRHGDMLHQYAHCLNETLFFAKDSGLIEWHGSARNLSIYVDVWCSLNGRISQRMFDPKADLLKAPWSPFESVTYLMPLLDEALTWRSFMHDMRRKVHAWHNGTDVSFYADFPGYEEVSYIPTSLDNATLTVLQGNIIFESDSNGNFDDHSHKLSSGAQMKVPSGTFHKVLIVGETPAYLMYTFVNKSLYHNAMQETTSELPIVRDLVIRAATIFYKADKALTKYILEILFNYYEMLNLL